MSENKETNCCEELPPIQPIECSESLDLIPFNVQARMKYNFMENKDTCKEVYKQYCDYIYEMGWTKSDHIATITIVGLLDYDVKNKCFIYEEKQCKRL